MISRFLHLGAIVALAANAHAHATPTVTFDEQEYALRSVEEAVVTLNPPAQISDDKWKDLLAISYYPNAQDTGDLREIADGLQEDIRAQGRVIRALEAKNEDGEVLGYLVIGMLKKPDFMEATMNRLLLEEGEGVMITYQRRFYSRGQAVKIVEWFQENGFRLEKALLMMDPVPQEAFTSKEEQKSAKKN